MGKQHLLCILDSFRVAVAKYPEKKQLKGRRIHSGTQLKHTVHRSKEVKAEQEELEVTASQSRKGEQEMLAAT